MRSFLILSCVLIVSCGQGSSEPASTTGIKKVNPTVAADPNTGMTVEQSNIAERLKRDNLPGSIKHLYVISPVSGQVLIYSTVKGKVTSSGKRLTPKTVACSDGHEVSSVFGGFSVNFDGAWRRTGEVLQDDGTYGDSAEYLYWFDAAGRYHQHYMGDEILHISDQPLAVKSIVLNMETSSAGPELK